MPSFSTTLEQAIHSALALANSRRHELATLEHLLLALIDEPDAARVMKACSVDLDELKKTLVDFIDDDLSTLVTNVDGTEAEPTPGPRFFERDRKYRTPAPTASTRSSWGAFGNATICPSASRLPGACSTRFRL